VAKTIELPVKVTLDNAWLVRPGDKLVLGFAYCVGAAEAADIAAKVSAELPGVDVTVIDNLAHMAVYRPKEDS
jgi:hypothetical protein